MEWRDVKGYEGLYKVSDTGEVWSVRNNQILKPILKSTGYYNVNLHNKGRKMVSTHRLVAEHFIPNLENKHQVNHIDGVKTNNHVNNLEWVTKSENRHHALKIGLQKKFTNKKVRVINMTTSDEKLFNSHLETGLYFGFGRSFVQNRIKREGNPFIYKNYTVEVV